MSIMHALSQWEFTRSAEPEHPRFHVEAAMAPRTPFMAVDVGKGDSDNDAVQPIPVDEWQYDRLLVGWSDHVVARGDFRPFHHRQVEVVDVPIRVGDQNRGDRRRGAALVMHPRRPVSSLGSKNVQVGPARSLSDGDGHRADVDGAPGVGGREHRHDDADEADDAEDGNQNTTQARPPGGIGGDRVLLKSDLIGDHGLPHSKSSEAQGRVLLMSLFLAVIAGANIMSGRRVPMLLGSAALVFALLSVAAVGFRMIG